MQEYRVVGVMSGSSLDGLDVCLVRFRVEDTWSFQFEKAHTYELTPQWLDLLRKSPTLNLETLKQLDLDYGKWIGEKLNHFLSDTPAPDLIGVHGHTVHHDPSKNISFQLGNGETLASTCGIPCITDFRIGDILKGGQGAPLVPVGEFYLFPAFDAFVNLGGIANMTSRRADNMVAWDIAPCNQVFNHIVGFLNQSYDNGGSFARSGNLDEAFMNYLNSLAYFKEAPPKSLGNHWVKDKLLAKIVEGTTREELANYGFTFATFLANQIASDLKSCTPTGAQVLFSGGGTYNEFLMELIKSNSSGHFKVIKPTPEIIDYKEALIFGFLGLLRIREEVNVFSSVTGAKENSSTGKISLPQ